MRQRTWKYDVSEVRPTTASRPFFAGRRLFGSAKSSLSCKVLAAQNQDRGPHLTSFQPLRRAASVDISNRRQRRSPPTARIPRGFRCHFRPPGPGRATRVFKALRLLMRFPSRLRGPVDLAAFLRFASSFRADGVRRRGSRSNCGISCYLIRTPMTSCGKYQEGHGQKYNPA